MQLLLHNINKEYSIIQHVYYVYVRKNYCKILSVNKDVLVSVLFVDAYLVCPTVLHCDTYVAYAIILTCESVISIITYPHIAILAINNILQHCPTLLTTPQPLCALVPRKLLDSRCGELRKYTLNLALHRWYFFMLQNKAPYSPQLHRDPLQ